MSTPESGMPLSRHEPLTYDGLTHKLHERFFEAVVAENENPDFVYVAMGHNEDGIDDPMALIAVVNKYAGKSIEDKILSRIGIGVPLESSHLTFPRTNLGDAWHDAFVVYGPGKKAGEIVTRDGYDKLVRSRRTAVHQLASMVMYSEVFPIIQSRRTPGH